MNHPAKARIERALPAGFQLEGASDVSTLLLTYSINERSFGYATLNMKTRSWALGANTRCTDHGIRLGIAARGYQGRGWAERLALDAADALRRATERA